MATKITESTWETTLPDGWEWQRDDECLTLYDPDGMGALQVSVAVKDSPITDKDLCGFAIQHIEAGAQIRDLSCGDFSGFTLAFGAGDAYWRHWYLRAGKQMLIITYNCSSNDRGVEDEPIAIILGNLHRRVD